MMIHKNQSSVDYKSSCDVWTINLMNQPKFNESLKRRGKRYNKTLGANAINSKISGFI